jgi:ATP/maltotriose-dependent transcriptional regulator MalT
VASALGVMALEDGDHLSAVSMLRHAVTGANATGYDRLWLAEALVNVGANDEALDLVQRVIGDAHRFSVTRQEVVARVGLALWFVLSGRADEAIVAAEQAERLADKLQDQRSWTYVRVQRARALFDKSEHEEAETLVRSVLEASLSPPLAKLARVVLAEILVATGRATAAIALLQGMEGMSQDTRLFRALVLARANEASGALDRARDLISGALSELERTSASLEGTPYRATYLRNKRVNRELLEWAERHALPLPLTIRL